MSWLRRSDTRWVWRWCVTYTWLAPAGARQSRRLEIRSHLWESEAAGLPALGVLLAAARGAPADLGWAVALRVMAAGRWLLTPTPWVAAALLFPLQAAFVSSRASQAAAHPFELAGTFGGFAMLGVAALLWWLRRPSP